MRLTVVGSINLDFVASAPSLPRAGKAADVSVPEVLAAQRIEPAPVRAAAGRGVGA